MLLKDKIALVTGAGRGMGKSHAIQFAMAGAHVAVDDIDGRTAEATSIAVKELGQQSLAIQADVGDLAEVDRMVRETVDTFGRIDILVNNAGVSRQAYIMDITEEDWDQTHRVNAKGVFFSMQRVAREMIAQGQGGRIINIASIAGKGHPDASNAAYAASKAAVIAMTQLAAHQLGQYNINVNAICPGVTRTGMLVESMAVRSRELGVSLEETERQRALNIPIRRFNEPEDISDMVLFLAGPGSRNITGQAFNVDGGKTMH